MSAAPASQDDSDQFIQAAIDALDEPGGNEKYAENVYRVADWAVEVDDAFSNVKYGLTNVNTDYGSKFPDLEGFLKQWQGYWERWTAHLVLSKKVASKQAAVLKRFDKVYLNMVQKIKSDQDREEVIKALAEFADEDHGESGKMAEGFKSLKGDIQVFVVKFDEWIKQTGTELGKRAEDLKKEINTLQEAIETLDKEIVVATVALLASAAAIETLVAVVGLVGAAIALAVLVAKRVGKSRELTEKRNDLAEVNAKQEALAHIKTSFDGLKPEIAMICHRLALFGEIWDSVRNQTRAFQKTLEKGLEATSDERFKKHVELAQKICTPLCRGLDVYAEQLRKREPKTA